MEGQFTYFNRQESRMRNFWLAIYAINKGLCQLMSVNMIYYCLLIISMFGYRIDSYNDTIPRL